MNKSLKDSFFCSWKKSIGIGCMWEKLNPKSNQKRRRRRKGRGRGGRGEVEKVRGEETEFINSSNCEVLAWTFSRGWYRTSTPAFCLSAVLLLCIVFMVSYYNVICNQGRWRLAAAGLWNPELVTGDEENWFLLTQSIKISVAERHLIGPHCMIYY